ncbi:MAG: hypothetical protein JWQ45_33, partial [Blastococcus sp.]|nr:hypothetical protein [Blastococcus sp.]
MGTAASTGARWARGTSAADDSAAARSTSSNT